MDTVGRLGEPVSGAQARAGQDKKQGEPPAQVHRRHLATRPGASKRPERLCALPLILTPVDGAGDDPLAPGPVRTHGGVVRLFENREGTR